MKRPAALLFANFGTEVNDAGVPCGRASIHRPVEDLCLRGRRRWLLRRTRRRIPSSASRAPGGPGIRTRSRRGCRFFLSCSNDVDGNPCRRLSCTSTRPGPAIIVELEPAPAACCSCCAKSLEFSRASCTGDAGALIVLLHGYHSFCVVNDGAEGRYGAATRPLTTLRVRRSAAGLRFGRARRPHARDLALRTAAK